MMGEHALDEPLSRIGIGKAPFVGDGQIRQPRHQRGREQAASGRHLVRGTTVRQRFRNAERNAVDAAARRVGLEYVSVQVREGEFLDPSIGEAVLVARGELLL